MKFRTDESFLFPASQLDFKRDHILFPQGGLHGFGRISDENIPYVTTKFGAQNLYLNADQVAAALSQYPDTPVDANGDLLRSNWIRFYISKVFPNPTTDYDKRARAEYEQIIADLVAYEQTPQAKALIASASSTAAAQDRAYYEASEARAKQENAARAAAEAAAAAAQADEAARQAAAQAQAQQAAQQAAAQQAAAAQADAVAKAAAATANAQAVQAVIDAQLKAQQAAAAAAAAQPAPTAKEVKAATDTQKTAVDTSTGTVKTVDTASGTTSTVNAATGQVTLTNTAGQTVTGTGTVTAGGVTTTVNPTTGVVTTQNTQTGVATQTNAGTGQTQTAVQVTGTAATGGTFMLPDGGTVTTTESITSAALSPGHIALAALVGILLLRGAIR
jgi:multidrug efflux pump subunit AcrA (membrane-fusion protein)